MVHAEKYLKGLALLFLTTDFQTSEVWGAEVPSSSRDILSRFQSFFSAFSQVRVSCVMKYCLTIIETLIFIPI